MMDGLSAREALAIADSLDLLNGIDEGENTDSAELQRLSGCLRHAAEQHGDYRLWVSNDRCGRMEIWGNGDIIVAFREHASRVWGPPMRVHEEKVPA